MKLSYDLIKDISSNEISYDIEIFGKEFPRAGCIGHILDRVGSAGLPNSELKNGVPLIIQFNGDLILTRNSN